MSNAFNASALDKLIDESLMETNQLKNELSNIDVGNIMYNESSNDDYLPDDGKSWSQTNGVVDKTYGNSISFDYVYKKIGQLIDTGNATMQLLQSIDPDVTNPATLGATASLMNSIKGCISEFTKIHHQYIKFQHMVELEKIKLENKKEFTKYKKDLIEGKLSSDVQKNDLIEMGSTDLLDFIEYQKNKKG